MPISPVDLDPVQVRTPSAAAAAPEAVERGGPFARSLAVAAARFDATRRPTVSLAEMVAAYVDGVVAPPAAASVTTGAPASAGPQVLGTGGQGARILAAGERYLGTPYRWGGTSQTSGFDCSGFVQRVFADLGVSLPRVSVDQARAGTPVASLAEARPGDLVFWHADGRRPNHIGIYAGDGRMLVAPRTGDVVRYQDITRTPHVIRRVM
jgi:cell wall-associated NlpC family hydrolase